MPSDHVSRKHRDRSSHRSRHKHHSSKSAKRKSRSPDRVHSRNKEKFREPRAHRRSQERRSPSSSSHSSSPRRKRSDRHWSRDSSKSDNDRNSSRRRRRHQRSSESSRSSSSSASDGSSRERSPSPCTLLARLQAEREQKKEEKRRQKELMKRLETPAQKRQRRLQKRADKERLRKQKMGWDEEHLHYTNDDNPFGDANLLGTFRWDKKLHREGLQDVAADELDKINRRRMQENRRELEKVKARRLERERERAEREQELSLMQGKLETEQFKAWEKQEDQFHLKQCRLRSKIRIQEGRAKPIDLLAKYISSVNEVDAVEVHEPYNYLLGLSAADLDDLLADIAVYQRLEQGANLDYWNDVTILVRDELQQLRRMEQQQLENAASNVAGRRDGVHDSVSSDVMAVFRGKSAEQLSALQTQIESKLKSRLDGVDVGYWESLLSSLKAHVARARLRDRHQLNLREKLRLLKASQGVTDADGTAVENQATSSSGQEPPTNTGDMVSANSGGLFPSLASSPPPSSSSYATKSRAVNDGDDDDDDDILESALREYSEGRYTPPLIMVEHLEAGQLINDPAEDEQRLQHARDLVLKNIDTTEASGDEDAVLRKEARKDMDTDEAQFSVEADLGPQHHLWSDKYRPRKPRYFNRVHTGFEWNKYNQTHYDMDNPPPKVVQGYKFNIFYPDMIDKSATPEYTLTPCEDNKDFCILKFHTGPPYQDIAFKIVSREWEHSYRRGFRCQFYNNIFQLWFHFKRYRYRR